MSTVMRFRLAQDDGVCHRRDDVRRSPPMTVDLLSLQSFSESLEAALDARYAVHRLHRAADPTPCWRRLARRCADRHRRRNGRSGRALVPTCRRWRSWRSTGVGLDAVDLDQAAARGVSVTTTPGVLTDDVADPAIGLWLALSRRMMVSDRFVRPRPLDGGGEPAPGGSRQRSPRGDPGPGPDRPRHRRPRRALRRRDRLSTAAGRSMRRPTPTPPAPSTWPATSRCCSSPPPAARTRAPWSTPPCSRRWARRAC